MSYEKTLTIGQFIENLLRGDGWHCSGIPTMIGKTLERLDDLDRDQVVMVKFRSVDYGSGCRSWSEYDWEVMGLTLPTWAIPGTAPVFGGVPDVQIEPIPGGVVFRHESGAVRNRW